MEPRLDLVSGECPSGDLVAALVAGELPSEARAAIANHAATCGPCHAWIEGLVECIPSTEDGSDRDERATTEFTGTDRFAVARRIGAGGMGVVYEVWDRDRQAAFALKTLYTLSPRRLSLFKQEFRSLRGLSHRNLVTLSELVHDRGQWFFTMELVDGVPLLAWVCPGGVLDDDRLRDGLRQLAAALAALHGTGKIHCDIKPTNVLVTPEGRLVVLDFGLVRDVRHPDEAHRLRGTPAYMAPEQASAGAVGPAADWYAVGVMLYAALCGRLPFGGSVDEVLRAKLAGPPVRPSELAERVPADLDALCMRLLATDPAARAGAAEVARAVGGDTRADVPAAEVFLGRAAELRVLDDALDDGGPLAIAIRGESGVGKSTLLERWLAGAARRGAVVLAGRCGERESVPYKAVDGVIDALARWLSTRPAGEVRELARSSLGALLEHGAAEPGPRAPGVRAALLARVFPVLAVLGPVASAPPTNGDPAGERRMLFEALRALLDAIARRYRLVVSIDDLQWADADSLALLGAVLRGPGAPALLLVVAERRDESAGFVPPCPARELDVGPLAPAEAAQLAGSLLAGSSDDAAAVATEARGHPLFVMELARARHRRDAGSVATLDDALAQRIATLDTDARAVIEVVGAAGAPVPQAVIAEASGVALGALAALLVQLRDVHLVRSAGAGTEDRVDAYHSRVRAAALRPLDAERARGIHARLATALERRPGVDPERLYGHWLEAGERALARRYAVQAADVAAAALAFDHAARLYRAALELGDGDALALHRRLAAVLMDGGRCAEAARVYQRAATHAGTLEAQDLRRQAAEQLLRSGEVDAGVEALGEVLAGVGLRMPAAGARALPSAMASWVALRVRGLELRRGVAPDPVALARVDACWSAAAGLLAIDGVRAAAFVGRTLRLALDAGDPGRAALAMAYAAVLTSRSARSRPRVDAVLDQARTLADESRTPRVRGVVAAASGMCALWQGRFGDALALSEDAERILGTGTGLTWERDAVDLQITWALTYLGRYTALAARVPDLLATERDERRIAMGYRWGVLASIPAFRGDLAGARHVLDEGVRMWTERGFRHEAWHDLFARVELDLHGDDASAALARMHEGWPALRRNHVLAVQLFRAVAHFVRGRAALRRAQQVGVATSRGRELLRAAAADAARLRREDVRYSLGYGELVGAGIAAARGDRDTARELLHRSAYNFDASGVALLAAAARSRLAELIGGSAGQRLRASAEAYAARERITAFAAVVETAAPGF